MSIFLGFGSNEGDSEAVFRQAFLLLEKRGVHIVSVSPFYETEPWGNKNQPWFLNCCAEVDTGLTPEQLLETCQNIEQQFGRKKKGKWAQRSLDIDILFFHKMTKSSIFLTIPHPCLLKRRFVLQPMTDIAPDFIHPIVQKPIRTLLKECIDACIVRLHDEIKDLPRA